MVTTAGRKIMKNFFKKYWWTIIVFAFTVGGYITKTELSMASNSEDIVDLKVIAQQNNEMLKGMKAQYDLIIQLYLNITGDTVKNWKNVPRKAPIDGMGNPVIGGIWLELSDDNKYAAFYKFDDTGKVVENVLWNIKDK